LKQNGVKAEDIKTSEYSLTPQYDYNWCHKSEKDFTPCSPKIIGYSFTQSAAVKIRNFDTINTIIGGLSAKGANTISDITFTIDDPESYKNQARIEALNKIKTQAQVLSKETDIKIGKIISVNEGSYPTQLYENNVKATLGSVPQASTPAPIETGTQEISVTMTVSYEIK
jgi:uncharacterized protein YggE